MIDEKAKCRHVVRKILKSLQEDGSFSSKSSLVSKNLRAFLLQEKYIQKKIGGFYPLDDEVNWLQGNEDLNLSFPKILDDGVMIFRSSKVDDLEVIKVFGREFREPKEVCESLEPEVVLVPGLAFDKSGHRLGRGKGFYDNYLKNKKLITIGICFSDQLLSEVPVDERDVDMNYVITESEVIKIGNRSEE